MAVNILIICFVLGMMYWWALQGFFSSFLHLVVTIAAGALAFSLWEPLVEMWLIKMQPSTSWGTGLIAPFILAMIILRVATDKLIPQNVIFDDIINKVLGAICGFFSGVISAGICLLAIGFLPLGPSLMGYQPYVYAADGTTERSPGQSLWLSVDTMTAGFYSQVSRGSLSPWNTRESLAYALPDVAQLANLYRLRKHENASTVAVPGSFTVDKVWVHDTPIPGGLRADVQSAMPEGERLRVGDNRLVVIHTTYARAPGTTDQDSTIRLAMPSIRLVTHNQVGSGISAELHAPRAVITEDKLADTLEFNPVQAADYTPYSPSQEEMFGFVFLVPDGAQPAYLLVRRLSLPLLDRSDIEIVENSPDELRAAMGKLPSNYEPVEIAENNPNQQTSGSGDVNFTVSNELPQPISRNMAHGFDFENTSISSTNAEHLIQPPQGRISRSTRVDSISEPGHLRTIRAAFPRDRANSIFGSIMLAAASLEPATIRDNQGENWNPIAYVHLKGKAQLISINKVTTFKSMRQFPIDDMKDGDVLYLYWQVPAGVTVTGYNFGRIQGDVNLRAQ